MTRTYSWAQMLTDFRALGGVADNVQQCRGQYGNGLFPIDPHQPVTLTVPEALLVDAEHFVLEGNDLVIRADVQVPEEVRTFLTQYQRNFSWGADGRRSVEAFELALKTMPPALLKRLKEIALLDLEARHAGDWHDVLRERFLQSRKIVYQTRRVIMPIIELINHGARSKSYAISNGISFTGTFPDEITVCYSSTTDALRRFLNYGFANHELSAYSLPTTFRSDSGLILEIDCETASNDMRDGLPLPQVEIKSENHLRLSHLRLGYERMPRMPKTLFRKVIPDSDLAKTDELFDRIRNANQLELCNLLELSEESNESISKEFRKALLQQLKALTYCYGARTIN